MTEDDAKHLASYMMITEKDPKKACTAFYRQMQREVKALLREQRDAKQALLREQRIAKWEQWWQDKLADMPWLMRQALLPVPRLILRIAPMKLVLACAAVWLALAVTTTTITTLWQAMLQAMVRSLGLG